MEKTKGLISFAVTAKLICVFVFAYAKSRFSHNEAQMMQIELQTMEPGQAATVSRSSPTRLDGILMMCLCLYWLNTRKSIFSLLEMFYRL